GGCEGGRAGAEVDCGGVPQHLPGRLVREDAGAGQAAEVVGGFVERVVASAGDGLGDAVRLPLECRLDVGRKVPDPASPVGGTQVGGRGAGGGEQAGQPVGQRRGGGRVGHGVGPGAVRQVHEAAG